EPLVGSSRLLAVDFSLMVKHGLAPFYQWVNVDMYYLGIWRWLLSLAGRIGRASLWLEERALATLLILTVATFALAALLIPELVSSTQAPRLAAHVAQAGGGTGALMVPIGIALAGLLLVAHASARDSLRLPLLAVAGILALVGLGTSGEMIRLLLLESASLVALLLVWREGKNRSAAHAYLLAILLSAAATVGGTTLLGHGPATLAPALLLAGLTLKFALFPLYLWLPKMAESTPAPIAGLIVAVVDVAGFGEVLTLQATAPSIFVPVAPWLVVGVLSALTGGVLMLAQRDVKRMLAFSTIEDMGVLLLGISLGGPLGTAGAVVGLIVHSLAKALLFSSLAIPELTAPVTLGSSKGLTARFPLSGAGFLLGALAVLGVPPTLGYAAHWRLYSAAVTASPLLLAVLMLSTAMALLSYARIVGRCWWGPCEDETNGGEPALLKLAVVGLGVVLLAAGLWPSLMSAGL
ncbi:MAG TPA: proton-conducting transporter membrane subunit, partial [Chloroflexota bacterium]|nr:proton-conducting transporter membrane subunit [Chloroflexota bacterium]